MILERLWWAVSGHIQVGWALILTWKIYLATWKEPSLHQYWVPLPLDPTHPLTPTAGIAETHGRGERTSDVPNKNNKAKASPPPCISIQHCQRAQPQSLSKGRLGHSTIVGFQPGVGSSWSSCGEKTFDLDIPWHTFSLGGQREIRDFPTARLQFELTES